MENLQQPELYFPLKLYVCDHCWLVQTQDFARFDELFTEDYAYFSSVSKSWLEHASRYSKMIQKRLSLDPSSFVIEIASNDGYLLKNFVSKGIPCLGIEPADSTADAAEQLGIPVLRQFFKADMAEDLASNGKQADLIIGNNVYAHVPDINDFTAGLKTALKPGGAITLEFPHLMRLIEQNQFDTVYHEHFSYLSLYTVARIFDQAGLRVFDVEELPTHGGSLRVYGCHADDAIPGTSRVEAVLEEEKKHSLRRLDTYLDFQLRANKVKDDFLTFLIEQKRLVKTVAAYGAAAKGNTLLNYAGVKSDLLAFVCDAATSKQGKFMPGSHIPILPPFALAEHQPDWVVILSWNIANEVIRQRGLIRDWGGKFVVAVPELKVL
jgi:2-polyprenyl-3-methyl-5-hydroxy-6-metoxy-1,4-benzoquinol methylase